MKPKVYLETTIASYLAARPSRDLIVAGHQQITHRWWDTRRNAYDLYASTLVLEEAAEGDPDAAQRRAAVIRTCRMLVIDTEALDRSRALIRAEAVPKKATADSLHIAIAALNGVDFLLTWNCAHINNADRKPVVESVCAVAGYHCPVICTPEELMGGVA